MAELECRQLSRSFGPVRALEGVTLAAEPGRILGLLGPNGSGKTTLIKLANGLLRPSGGEILVCGAAPGPETRAQVSYMPERLCLPEWMSVERIAAFYADFYADFDAALKFQSEVKPGGLLLVNSSIIEEKSNRDDCDVVYVPCNHIAEKLGNPKAANVVFLGAYIAKKPEVVSEETIIEAIRVELGERKAKFLEGNIQALKAGMDYVKSLG